jgi:hypothetical protein
MSANRLPHLFEVPSTQSSKSAPVTLACSPFGTYGDPIHQWNNAEVMGSNLDRQVPWTFYSLLRIPATQGEPGLYINGHLNKVGYGPGYTELGVVVQESNGQQHKVHLRGGLTEHIAPDGSHHFILPGQGLTIYDGTEDRRPLAVVYNNRQSSRVVFLEKGPDGDLLPVELNVKFQFPDGGDTSRMTEGLSTAAHGPLMDLPNTAHSYMDFEITRLCGGFNIPAFSPPGLIPPPQYSYKSSFEGDPYVTNGQGKTFFFNPPNCDKAHNEMTILEKPGSFQLTGQCQPGRLGKGTFFNQVVLKTPDGKPLTSFTLDTSKLTQEHFLETPLPQGFSIAPPDTSGRMVVKLQEPDGDQATITIHTAPYNEQGDHALKVDVQGTTSDLTDVKSLGGFLGQAAQSKGAFSR